LRDLAEDLGSAAALWEADVRDGTVTRLNSATGRITTTVHIPRCCDGEIAIANNGVWVANSTDDAVYEIDPATNRVTRTLKVESTPRGIAIDHGLIWLAHKESGLISWRSIATGKTLGTTTVHGFAAAIAIYDHSLWVQSFDEQTVYRLATP
jgi:YVTN family beta-propeller protein